MARPQRGSIRIVSQPVQQAARPLGGTGPSAREAARTDAVDEAAPGLAVVVRLPAHRERTSRRATAGPSGAVSRPIPLSVARARRRGPLVRAVADQRDRRLARLLHPAGERDR